MLILAFSLMLADQTRPAVHLWRNRLAIVVYPIEYLVNLPIVTINWFVDDFALRKKLLKENAELHSQAILLQAKIQKQYALEAENEQLRALLQSDSAVTANEKLTTAGLLAVSSSAYLKQVVLDKGENEHIFIGQPVLDPYGVMGQVIRVEPLTSRVMLLTDPKSAIPVQVKRNGLRAIAVGDPAHNRLRLVDITETMDIKEGDELVTSGLGSLYPFGYPVGVVTAVKNSGTEQFTEVLVEPTARLNRSRLVLLVWPQQQASLLAASQKILKDQEQEEKQSRRRR